MDECTRWEKMATGKLHEAQPVVSASFLNKFIPIYAHLVWN